MQKPFRALVAVLALTTAFVSAAEAFERRGSVTGPRGNTFSSEGSVTRNGAGGYDYNRSVTGPGGNTWSNSGSVTRDGEGGFSREGQRSNPYGGGATYGGSGQCSGGVCTYSGSRSRY
ncbi:MAG: hypothetical protein NW215_12725 [Hyphomicrobiales bacterium]|nr:hypothetical protein [Hyphomicrobiales bacterium]